MANHPSARKRARQTVRRNARNRALRSTLRTTLKQFRSQVRAKDVEGAETALPQVYKAIDKAVTKGVIHRNAAARHKSRAAAALKRSRAA